MDDKGTLTIETRVEGKQIRLYIADTGIGIPENELERLFEPFFTTKTKGTGLGLALCMSIVQRHHGTIDVKSRQGEGTVFIISFPLDPYVHGLPESQLKFLLCLCLKFIAVIVRRQLRNFHIVIFINIHGQWDLCWLVLVK